MKEATNATDPEGGEGGGGGVTVNIHALGRDPPCPCHTATPKRYLLSARVTTASSASFRDKASSGHENTQKSKSEKP